MTDLDALVRDTFIQKMTELFLKYALGREIPVFFCEYDPRTEEGKIYYERERIEQAFLSTAIPPEKIEGIVARLKYMAGIDYHYGSPERGGAGKIFRVLKGRKAEIEIQTGLSGTTEVVRVALSYV